MDKTQKSSALVAAILLFVMAILAGIAYGYIFSNIYVVDNATATYNNLNGSILSFRIMIFLFIIIMAMDIVIAWALYIFFKKTNESLSLLMAWIRIVYAALLACAVFSLSDAIQLLGAGERNETAVMNSLVSFLDVWSLILLSLHLFLLALLIFKSKDVPNALGVLAIIAAICYFGTDTLNLLWPQYKYYKDEVDQLLAGPMALGELGLAGWFIFKVVMLKRQLE